MPRNFTITLPEAQWHVIQQCVDCAIKTGGLAGAVAILPVWREMEEQIKPQMSSTPSTNESGAH